MVSGLYDVVPEKSGQVDNLIADSSKYGAWRQYFNGIDVTVNVRVGQDFTLVGGTSTGQTVADNCDVRAHLPELATTTTGTSAFGAGLAGSAVTPVSPYCHVAFGILTQFRGLSSYIVPEGRRPAGRDVSEQAGGDAGGELRGAELGRGAVAWQESLGKRGQRDGEPGGARDDVRRSHQSARRSRGQDPEDPAAHER